MSVIEDMALRALRSLDPERAHGLAIKALKLGLAPKIIAPTSPRLTQTLAGLSLPNPVGLAAGFDKNAEAISPLLNSGFGFVEIGAVTPRPQPGNPKPRLFRLTDDRAVINRFGFNNEGADAVAARLDRRPENGILGINLGANKDSDDKAQDFASVLTTCGGHVDFATVNVSSPNTENLRDLQGKDALAAVLAAVINANAQLANPVPVFLKVAPDLQESEIDDIVEVALASGIAGIFATNTTLARPMLQSHQAAEKGGLSGAPLFALSTAVLAHFASRLDGKLPLIGIGGIETAAQALAKIEAGAQAVQLYSALVYHGLSLGHRIAQDLDGLMAAKGYSDIATARGTRVAEFAKPLS